MNYYQHRSKFEVLGELESALLSEVRFISERFDVQNTTEGAHALRNLLNYADAELDQIDDIIGVLEPIMVKAIPRDFQVNKVSIIPIGIRILGEKHRWNV